MEFAMFFAFFRFVLIFMGFLPSWFFAGGHGVEKNEI